VLAVDIAYFLYDVDVVLQEYFCKIADAVANLVQNFTKASNKKCDEREQNDWYADNEEHHRQYDAQCTTCNVFDYRRLLI